MSDFSFPNSTAVPFAMPNAPQGIAIDKVFLGNGLGTDRFGVAVAHSNSTPSLTDLRAIHAARVGKTGAKIVVAVVTGDRCVLFGPGADAQPFTLKTSVAKVFLGAVLDEPDLLSAYRRFSTTKRAVEVSETPWFTNHGLFASYHVRENAPKRKDWDELNQTYLPLIKKRGAALINSLGFTSTKNEDQVLILSSTTDSSVVAILLQDDETFEGKSNRFQSSPVTWALKVAADRQIPWVVALKKGSLRLYPAKDGVGVGQRGQVETFFELDLELLDSTNAGYLGLVFSEFALRAGGSADNLISDSARYSTSLGDRLRDRIYLDVVPDLAKEVAAAIIPEGESKTPDRLQEAYSLSLRILFRLLFQAYAEDRGLLPAGRNAKYDEYSLKTLAQMETAENDSREIWNRLVRVWSAIESGDEEFGIPAYGGGLFNVSQNIGREATLMKLVSITDQKAHAIIKNLVVDVNEDNLIGPVDFRSLSVREFGTIYEGLLESSLSVAETDLTLDKNGVWIPATQNSSILAKQGEIYFHSSSGTRKSTGSYYTPSVLVDWIIRRSIEPKIDAHLNEVSKLIREDEVAKAGELFFDFRIADLAMGSGHFLVAAIDLIESKMRSFLADPRNNIPRVSSELETLGSAAKNALGSYADAFETIEPATLLRRQIARRCVYGMDINPLAVELSRLAIWIHTFVPGLPMSSLEHGLVCANSLTGVGQIDEALSELQKGIRQEETFYEMSSLEKSLYDAKEIYRSVASNSESTKSDLEENAAFVMRAKEKTEPAKRSFDAAVAIRLQLTSKRHAETEAEVEEIASNATVIQALEDINCAHFPHLFPEVFARINPGFDAIVGNPPWEKLHIEEINWWGRYLPGIRSDTYPKAKRDKSLKEFRANNPNLETEYQSARQTMEKINTVIKKGPYPGISKAHVDLFSAFAWRNWQLIRNGGIAGVILPRTAHIGEGLSQWRETVLKDGSFDQITFVQNSGKWAFSAVDGRYTIGLTIISKSHSDEIVFNGDFTSAAELKLKSADTNRIPISEFTLWSEGNAVPLIEGPRALAVFRKMFRSPKFGDEFIPFFYRSHSDLNAKTDRALFNLWQPDTQDSCRVLTGGSFNIWNPDFGDPYGSTNLERIREEMLSRISRSSENASSPYYGIRPSVSNQPMTQARIAFRQITNRTNSRTTVVCLIPPNSVAVHMATLILRKRGTAKTDAFILGVMSSHIYDWFIRRWIEGTFTMKLLTNSPIPKQAYDSNIGNRLVNISARLAAVDRRFETWASECGVKVGSVTTEEEKEELICELDALAALAYGLSAEDVSLIMETFHVGWNYEQHLEKVLGYFEKWSTQ
jgi:hypothetical protein